MKKRFQPKFNIKKGDSIVVIAGDDKDRSTPRIVQAVYPQKGLVLIEGVNIITKHLKPNAQNPQGGIVKLEAPINLSNIMLWDAKAKQPSRIKRSKSETGWVRISKKTGEVIK
ncbi:MAG: 50S ribosomal protein L24 [Chitinophagaceae bacterium]|nr:50S ribosomal protein L24 [Chitinophagaceae bacterium]